MSDPYTLL